MYCCPAAASTAVAAAPVEQLLDLAGMQAVQELGERQQLAAVEVRSAKHLLQLVVQLCAAVPQVHDLRYNRRVSCKFERVTSRISAPSKAHQPCNAPDPALGPDPALPASPLQVRLYT